MFVNLAEMRHRVTIQIPQTYTDGEGNIIETGEPEEITVWAKVLPESSRTADGYLEVVKEVTYRIVIRYREDVREHYRIVWNGKTLEQTAPPYIKDGRKKYLILQARELSEDD